MEVENNVGDDAQNPLFIPCIRSLKRTYDLYVTNQLNQRIGDDMDSQRIRLYSKVQDEYASVRDLPPPAPPSSKALTTTPTTSSSSTSTAVAVTEKTETALSIPSDENPVHGELIDEDGEQVKVIGAHSYPSGPGWFFFIYKISIFIKLIVKFKVWI